MQGDKASRSELDIAVADLRKQLNVEQQAHTQTQQREESGNKRYQETYMQLQMRIQELRGMNTQVEHLQQQLETVEHQRCAKRLLSSVCQQQARSVSPCCLEHVLGFSA